ncbi:hypothetical protein Patl1_12474 [Pistacia atlantica]|uniref:Uncharacterized protein n=1 Tax=Pistacia atlantica TaxID=434234 RepID=A0ACC1AU64_9ROSI|nr:hypothetical protein Patl1_12474 [Pistacia atlantica]
MAGMKKRKNWLLVGHPFRHGGGNYFTTTTSHHQQQEGQVGRIENNNRTAEINNQKENGVSNSMFVKVKMEGVAIARKIDLKLYHCFYTLTNSLIAKFAKYGKCNKRGVRYTLTYQDKGGDWLLAGDVPWQTFMESVQRLEMVKSGVVGSSI